MWNGVINEVQDNYINNREKKNAWCPIYSGTIACTLTHITLYNVGKSMIFELFTSLTEVRYGTIYLQYSLLSSHAVNWQIGSLCRITQSRSSRTNCITSYAHCTASVYLAIMHVTKMGGLGGMCMQTTCSRSRKWYHKLFFYHHHRWVILANWILDCVLRRPPPSWRL